MFLFTDTHTDENWFLSLIPVAFFSPWRTYLQKIKLKITFLYVFVYHLHTTQMYFFFYTNCCRPAETMSLNIIIIKSPLLKIESKAD